MQIPLFPLPSNITTEINFVMPSVQMAMDYCSADATQEEALTTRYLNELQRPGDAFRDSALWTAQDRRTALWWVFTNSRIDTMLTCSYMCPHCGDIHFVDTDMRELADGLEVLSEGATSEYEGSRKDEPVTLTITHLDGRAMVHLESLRAQLPPEDSDEFRAEWINLRMIEIAHQLRFPDEPEDFLAAAEYRYNALREMDLEMEFQPLVASVQLFNRRNAHGLDIAINKGVTVLNLPDHPCPKSGKEGAAPLFTPLHLPFRNSQFLPNFRSEWLGYTDEQSRAVRQSADWRRAPAG